MFTVVKVSHTMVFGSSFGSPRSSSLGSALGAAVLALPTRPRTSSSLYFLNLFRSALASVAAARLADADGNEELRKVCRDQALARAEVALRQLDRWADSPTDTEAGEDSEPGVTDSAEGAPLSAFHLGARRELYGILAGTEHSLRA